MSIAAVNLSPPPPPSRALTPTISSNLISAAPTSKPTRTGIWRNGRGGRRSMRWATDKPQVIVGRYADVHKVFSDTETFASEMPRGPGWEAFNKTMDAQFVTQMDGEQHARVRRLLMPAFSSRRSSSSRRASRRLSSRLLDRDRSQGPAFDGMADFGANLVVDALAGGDRRHGRAAQGNLRRVPRPASGHHLRQAGRAVAGGPAPRLRPHHGRDQGDHRRAARAPAPRLHQRSRQCARSGDKLTDRELFDQIFGICGGSLSATSRAAGGALYLLYTHDDQRRRADRQSLL